MDGGATMPAGERGAVWGRGRLLQGGGGRSALHARDDDGARLRRRKADAGGEGSAWWQRQAGVVQRGHARWSRGQGCVCGCVACGGRRCCCCCCARATKRAHASQVDPARRHSWISWVPSSNRRSARGGVGGGGGGAAGSWRCVRARGQAARGARAASKHTHTHVRPGRTPLTGLRCQSPGRGRGRTCAATEGWRSGEARRRWGKLPPCRRALAHSPPAPAVATRAPELEHHAPLRVPLGGDDAHHGGAPPLRGRARSERRCAPPLARLPQLAPPPPPARALT